MDTQDFLRAVLGDEGHYCTVGITTTKQVIQKFYGSIDDVVATAHNFCEEKVNAYFALSTFTDGKHRRADKVSQLKAFWADLDCGGDKSYHYATQAEAFVALKQFCKEYGLPKPWVVNSGRGLHVYWALAAPVSLGVWQPIAMRFKHVLATAGVRADPACTADAARILRVPGTLNFKSDPPTRVGILQSGGLVDIEKFKACVGDPLIRPSFVPRETSDTVKALAGSSESLFKKILDRSVAGDGCAQIAYLTANQQETSEPLWRAGLSIAQHCSDRAKAIHFISRRHPNYSPDETELKASSTKGPYTCDTFKGINPDGCKDCPHKIKSPIVLGRAYVEAKEEDNAVVEKGQAYVIPKYPPPYFRGKNGGVYKRTKDSGDEVVEVPIYHNDIYVVRRIRDSESGESVVVRLHLPKDGVKDFTIPLAIVLSKDELRKHLAVQGVALVKVDELMYYLAAWTNQLQFEAEAEMLRRQFGWTSDKFNSFAWGEYEVFADRVEMNAPSPATAPLMLHMRPSGTLEEWKRIMLFYNQPNMEMHQFMIGLGFGSIFTAFTPINCAHLHIYSPDSGIGKTTSLAVATSIWGNPTQLMMKEKDTTNAKMLRAEVLKNIFMPIDELTNANAKDLSDFFYQGSSGMQKSRMMGNLNQERARGLTWQTLFCSTGNTSVLEKISTYKSLPKGEAMRVLEHRAVGVPHLDKHATDDLNDILKNNYGVAALPYLQYVLQNIDLCKQIYKNTQAALDKAANFGPAERFHSVLLAGPIAGLVIAKRMGLHEFNMKAVVAWALKMAAKARERVVDMDSDAEVAVSNYVAENYNNVLRIKSTDDVRGKASAQVGALDHLVVPDGTPRMSFAIRYEYDVKRMYLVIKPFKEWCIRQQFHYNGILENLQKGRTQAKIERKRMGKGTRMNLPPMPVIVLDCSGFMDDELDEQQAQPAQVVS